MKLSESLSRLESLLLITPSEGQGTSAPGNIERGLSTLEEHEERCVIMYYLMSLPDSITIRSRTSRVKHLSRVASEFNQLLYLADKARAEKCAFVGEIQWVGELLFERKGVEGLLATLIASG